MHFVRTRQLACGGFLLCVAGGVIAQGGPIVTGTEAGNVPHVKRFDSAPTEAQSFFAYSPAFAGGVTVATSDFNGDGVAEIVTGTGSGGAQVKVFDGVTAGETHNFLAFTGFTGGVYVASGDITGDGRGDIVVGAGSGGNPHVKAFDGQTLAAGASFFAYDASFTGGVRVAVGDVNNDGFADIITGTGPGASHVKVFDGQTLAEVQSFFAFTPVFSGGVYVAAGDVNGDGFADIITAPGEGSAGEVKVFDGNSSLLIGSFFAYSPDYTGGVRVAAGDIDNDGIAEILTGTGPGAAQVNVFDGQTLSQEQFFFPYVGYTGGIFVAGQTPVPEPAVLALPAAFVLTLARRRTAKMQ